MTRPKQLEFPHAKRRGTLVSITIPAEHWDRIEAAAVANGETVNAFCRRAAVTLAAHVETRALRGRTADARR